MSTDLNWTPYPGHHPGQEREHTFYAETRYRGMDIDLYEHKPGRYVWSFYDPADDDYPHAAPIARSDDDWPTVDAAAADVCDYIDGHLAEVAA